MEKENLKPLGKRKRKKRRLNTHNYKKREFNFLSTIYCITVYIFAIYSVINGIRKDVDTTMTNSEITYIEEVINNEENVEEFKEKYKEIVKNLRQLVKNDINPANE